MGPEDAIFTSPLTFFASAEAINLAEATPVFVGIDPNTYNIDPASLRRCIQNVLETVNLTLKGIIPVDLFSLAADYDEINAIADEHGLFVLEDAAQSFDANYRENKAGSLAGAAATSFTQQNDLAVTAMAEPFLPTILSFIMNSFLFAYMVSRQLKINTIMSELE